MGITHEYLHHRVGYRFGTHCCWLRIYERALGDAPVVLASEPTSIGGIGGIDVAGLAGMSEYLAAEVIQHHFEGSLPDLPRPLLWIEHHSNPRRHGSDRYFLLNFPSYLPRPAGTGFVRPITLGPPRREELSSLEVAILVE